MQEVFDWGIVAFQKNSAPWIQLLCLEKQQQQ